MALGVPGEVTPDVGDNVAAAVGPAAGLSARHALSDATVRAASSAGRRRCTGGT
jgi:hypothetical protein